GRDPRGARAGEGAGLDPLDRRHVPRPPASRLGRGPRGERRPRRGRERRRVRARGPEHGEGARAPRESLDALRRGPAVSEGRLVPRAVPATLLALAFAAAAAAAAVFLGPAKVSFGDALDALLFRDAPAIARDVVWVDRLPRIALGLGVGAALAVAGVLFQAILRNPLADPYLV